LARLAMFGVETGVVGALSFVHIEAVVLCSRLLPRHLHSFVVVPVSIRHDKSVT
jgi:hypothetical protein